MQELRAKLNKLAILKLFASTKLAVILLFFLIVLVVAGTIEQSQTGLYFAREKFFDSYLSFIGPIPLPGVLTVLWLMTINLSLSFLLRFNFTKKNTGLILSHAGLILLFVSGFFHFYFSKESFISIVETETKATSQAYDKWLLNINSYDKSFQNKETKSILLSNTSLDSIEFQDLKLSLEKKYTNAKVFHTPFAGTLIKEFPIEKEFEKNIPAVKLNLNGEELFLDGGENNYEKLFIKDRNILISLDREEYQMPFQIKLIDVQRELHPNSQIAKSYSSKVFFKDKSLAREATISMNKPIRSGSYTIYQAQYGINNDGQEFSVLAVVKNLNYQLPYWATFLINFGLFLHFIIAFLNYRRKNNA